MKARQHKKLCKKSAKAMKFKGCEFYDGLFQVFWEERGMDFTEYDSLPAWDWLASRFDAEVNTCIDHNSDCGISWKEDKDFLPATPKNVLSWARGESW